ncbi:MAG: dihydroorotate dehydrogenase electron transfer subunit [Endomicrobium sp.]|jgi:dihydroorotate dehydrogenase electron transfer subunit|nr:dihydroorotate dehydrogenase electron transfer subunit [Endomicrobium sp.]
MCVSKRFDGNYMVISNKEICPGYFELEVKACDIVKYCLPGQFFMIVVPNVFLRRPMSVHNVKKDIISFIYKVVGKGTKELSNIHGGVLQLLGPLGKGYNLECYKDLNNVIVSGGTGIVSLCFLASKLKKKGILYYGVRSKNDLICVDEFKKIGWKVIVSTEDGTEGYKGYITDVLEKKLKMDDVLFVCGPVDMIRKVSYIAKEKSIRGFVSLEEKMACGVGNCQGCAVKIGGLIRMVCKDGPVFKVEQVEWQ